MKFLTYLPAILFALTILAESAQASPDAINYQTAVRGDDGELMQNEGIELRFSVRSGSASGSLVFEETHDVTTNEFGIVSLSIGGGNVTSGSMSDINWGDDDHFLIVELDAGSGFENMGSQQLISVPYAKFSDEAAVALEMELENLNDLDLSDPQSGQILRYDGSFWQAEDLQAIENLEELSNVSTDAPQDDQILKWDGSEWVPADESGSNWTESGNDLYYDAGNVGIGTEAGSAPLTVGGDHHVQGELFINTDSSENVSYIKFRETVSGSSGPRIFHRGTDNILSIRGMDQVGIHTASPNRSFDVDGDALIRDDLSVSGNLGIGVSFPSEKLEVNGTSLFEDQVTMNDHLGIGESNPSAMVEIASPSAAADSIGLYLQGTNNYLKMHQWQMTETSGIGPTLDGDLILTRGNNTPRYIFWSGYFAPAYDGSPNLGSASYRWDNVYATNGTINTSDAREKSNIASTHYGLKEVMQMRAVDFEWKDRPEEGKKVGFVAQELLDIIPEVVVTEETVENRETGEMETVEAENYGVYYSDLIPVLTNAIQQQQEIIESQNQELQEIKQILENAGYEIEADE